MHFVSYYVSIEHIENYKTTLFPLTKSTFEIILKTNYVYHPQR